MKDTEYRATLIAKDILINNPDMYSLLTIISNKLEVVRKEKKLKSYLYSNKRVLLLFINTYYKTKDTIIIELHPILNDIYKNIFLERFRDIDNEILKPLVTISKIDPVAVCKSVVMNYTHSNFKNK
jgi:hypothetical protein